MKNTFEALSFANVILKNKIEVNSIVSIGCGDARSTITLSKKLKINLSNVYCFEKNFKLIKKINKKINAYNVLVSDKDVKEKVEKKVKDDEEEHYGLGHEFNIPKKKKVIKVPEKRFDTLSKKLKLPLIECAILNMNDNAHKVLYGIGELLSGVKAISISLEREVYPETKKYLKENGFVVYDIRTNDRIIYNTMWIKKND